MKINFTKRNNCRLCQSKLIKPILKLKSTPPANNFISKDLLNEKQELFPLELHFCENCGHVQLPYIVDPHCLFDQYVYVSGTSPVFVNHFKDYANSVINEYKPDKNNLIIDIGSNDGTLLSFFKESGYTVLGVDPAIEISKEANKIGIQTINSFFDYSLAIHIKNKFPKASIVAANNVFAHADDLNEIIRGVKEVLSDDGVFIFEVSYLVDVFQKTLFDTIYHEHLAYHSVKPLINFFRLNGMELIDAKRIKTHGGSIRGVAQLENGPHEINKNVTRQVLLEESLGLDKIETFQNFSSKIQNIKHELQTILYELKSQNKTIAGFGAPAKATTLMYEFELNNEIIDFIIDDNPLKQNTYTPGLHIPVLDSSSLETYKPDYLLILAWNFAESIINKNKNFLEQGGHFIVPLPEVNVI